MSGERKSSSPILTSLPMYCPGDNGCPKKAGISGVAEEDFFGEFWSTTFGTTGIVGQLFSRSSVFFSNFS